MYTKPKLPTGSGFSIWFNKKEKSEYYVTPLYLYKIQKVKYIYNKFDTIKVKKKTNKDDVYKEDSEYLKPYAERYGRFLLNFLNADFSSSETAYNTFFAFYGLELLKDYSDIIPYKKFYKRNEFIKIYDNAFMKGKEKILYLQKIILECVNFTYNLKDFTEYSEYKPIERFASYILRNDLYRYSLDTKVFFNNIIGYIPKLSRLENNKTPEIRKKINENEISLKTSNIFHSSKLSNIVFLSLYEIATNEHVIIKNCQNCGKYFIPTTKQTEIYCDITYYLNERSCRDTGASKTYKKNINKIDGYIIYRRTYQKVTMQIKRHPDISGRNVSLFNNWKAQAQSRIRAYKNGSLTEDELATWMKKHQNVLENFEKGNK